MPAEKRTTAATYLVNVEPPRKHARLDGMAPIGECVAKSTRPHSMPSGQRSSPTPALGVT
jgi:hypothetical protein